MTNVTVYSKADCNQCTTTMMALDKRGIEYTVKKVDEDPAALAEVKDKGYLAAPVVVTDTEHWSGFRPDKISQI